MRKLLTAFLLLVCSFGYSQTTTKPAYLHMWNDVLDLYCGEDQIKWTWTKTKIEVETTKGTLDLEIVKVLQKDSDGYINLARCKDQAGNLYSVQFMVKGSIGEGYQFIPDDAHRFTFFIANISVCD